MRRGVKRVVEAEKESRQVEASHNHMEKGGGGESWERGRARGKGEKRSKRRGGASSPFYSELGLPGCCQVTVRRSIPGCCQVTVGVEFRQNPNIPPFWFS